MMWQNLPDNLRSILILVVEAEFPVLLSKGRYDLPSHHRTLRVSLLRIDGNP